jgi:L,D-transpeptidase catalytic domain
LANAVGEDFMTRAGLGWISWRRVLACGVALAFIAGFVGSADAASRYGRTQTISKKREPAKAPFGELPKGPLQMVVSIGGQHVTLYANGQRIEQAKVSTGTPGHPTPMGVFSVIEKDRWHRSNLYYSAPMFYMHRLTWSGVAMHEGVLPGYAASHGCIRMPTNFVSRLWQISKLGVRVVIARNDPVPYEFDHPKLFNPSLKPVAQLSSVEPRAGLRTTLATAERPMVLAQATATEEPAHMTDAQPDQPAAQSETPAAGQPADVDTTAATPPAQATDAPAVAPAATPAVETAPGAEPEKRDPTEAEPRKPLPPRNRAGEPVKTFGQVAVFVSKREKKIFVRQGFVPLFDMPIEIANPDQPLGTHVFTAMEIKDGGGRMRWNAISMPAENLSRPVDVRGGKRPRNVQPVAAHDGRPPSTAAEALNRINLPPEAVERISELLTPGSSLIVSDHGLGRETGRYTEFIVLTH